MSKIRVLPREIVHRIAAGEVIERPASVVKELVENAIDAEATEVLVDLESGGLDRITVQDNGSGIDAEDLPVAFESHATSKLSEDDLQTSLFGVVTLGFRGEALPSISSVADVEVVTRKPRSELAYRFSPGKGDPQPTAGESGTVVEVRSLFHNVPARRKFLRSASAELSRVVTQVKRIALAYPGIRFLVSQGKRRPIDFAPCETLGERIRQAIDATHHADLLEFRESGDDSLPEIHGFISAPRWRRGDAREQHFFVNGRWVKDRTLSAALRGAYQGFLIPGQHPIAFLFLEFPTDAVDVNVHPTKSEVRFRDAARMYPLIRSAVRRALELPTAVEEPAPPRMQAGVDSADVDGSQSPSAEDAALAEGAERVRQAALDFFDSPKSSAEPRGRPPASRRGIGRGAERRPGPGPTLPISRLFRADAAENSAAENCAAEDRAGSPASREPPQDSEDASRHASTEGEPGRILPGAAERGFQILDSYIVVEDASGVVLIDQHALHEKVLFEEIHRRLLTGDVLQQRLIVPEVIALDVEDAPLVESLCSVLSNCGYEAEPFGDREVAIHAVPELFESRHGSSSSKSVVEAVVRWIAEDSVRGELPALVSEAGERVSASDRFPAVLLDSYRDLASLMACKRAVKAGARLSSEEISSLLSKGDVADDPRHCPHGRPTTVRLSHRDLERMFDRK